jgi:putative tricarboxylic transport membrane protein
VFFANFALLFVGLAFTRVSVYVTQIPNQVIAPIIVVLCIIGSFAINNSVFDVGLMLIFGIIGYVFDRLLIPTAPMVLGLILGPVLDGSLHQSLLIGDGSYLIFLESPISACLLAVALFSIIQSSPAGLWLGSLVRAVFGRKAA